MVQAFAFSCGGGGSADCGSRTEYLTREERGKRKSGAYISWCKKAENSMQPGAKNTLGGELL